MVKAEWKPLVAQLKCAYTSQNFLPDEMAWELWLRALSDLPAELVRYAIVVYIQSNHYPPTIADLREIASTLVNKDQMTEMQAWALVSKAVRNSSYNSEEQFRRLPELVQKAVGSASVLKEWALMEEDKISVAQSQFLRTYRSLQEREKHVDMLSVELKTALGIGMEDRTMIECDKAYEKRDEVEQNYVEQPLVYMEQIKQKLGLQ